MPYKHYFEEFFEQQSLKVQDKIIWTIKMLEQIERVPKTFLRHLEGTEGLYEIRV